MIPHKALLQLTTQERCKHRVPLVAAALSVALLTAACSLSTTDSMKEGKAYAEQGDLTAAVISFKNAVQKEPDSLPARLALAEALQNSDDLAGAEQQYRRAVELGGDANDITPRIALLLLDRGDAALLIKQFGNERLKDDKADADLNAILSLAYQALNQPSEAKRMLSLLSIKTPAVHLAEAQIAMLENRPSEALSSLDAALKDRDAPWWVWRGASRILAVTGDSDRSFSALENAYKLASWHHGVIGEYAERLIGAGRSAEAKPLRDKLHKIAPTYFRTLYIDALVAMNEGKLDDAWFLATKVLSRLPKHLPSQQIAAMVELGRGEFASAESRVGKILEQDPNSVIGLRLLTQLELRRNNLPAAEAALRTALRRAPNDAELTSIAAELDWNRGDKDKAIQQMAAAAQANPPQAMRNARLGEMYFAAGKRPEAFAALDKAIEISRTDAQHREQVFGTLYRMRLLDKAKAMAQAETERNPKDPAPIVWLAAVFGAEGNEPAALEQTRRALDLRADYFPALAALAVSARTPERNQEFEARLKKAVDAGSKDERIFLEQARRQRKAGAAPEKIGETYAKGLAANPASIRLRDEAIRYWMSTGRKEKAVALAKEGEAALPDNPAMLALAAGTLDAAGETQQALQKYAQLTARFPERIDLNLANAQALTRAGKTAEAIDALRKLINARPDEPLPYQALTQLQLSQKNTSDAQVTATMMRDKPKLRAPGWLLLGDVLAQAERKAEALKAYDEAAKAGATEAAVLRRAELLDKTGEEHVANKELAAWLSEHPDSLAALSLAARREARRQNHAAAAKYYEAIVKREPKNFMALNELAWAYAKLKNPASLATAKAAAEIAPENPNVLDTLAEAQNLAGQKNEAMTTLRQAITIAPGVAFTRIRLAELLLEAGKKKEAGEALGTIEERGLDKETAQRLKTVRSALAARS